MIDAGIKFVTWLDDVIFNLPYSQLQSFVDELFCTNLVHSSDSFSNWLPVFTFSLFSY